MPAIRLIAGLGNPGPQYEDTRHNVGARFVRMVAQRYAIALAPEPKFKGHLGRGQIHGHEVRLLVPSTFMNLSGESLGAVVTFYKIAVPEVLVVYDEMAFTVGVTRLRIGGGHNGHNGLKDIIQAFGNDSDFVRLRIGVGHPGDRDRVTAYLTGTKMPAEDREVIDAAIDLPDAVMQNLVAGDLKKAMNVLHSTVPSQSPENEGD